MGDLNLVTAYTFQGQEYLVKLNVSRGNLEVLVTDKSSGEEWQCAYDATYIENLTQKTGNFKQFDIFAAMLKSGLLRTSESVTLDLLTFEDLELLRSRKIVKSIGPTNANKRYLILTYVVEFDKIRYPLPLDYCGPPDPGILQATIRRLETELAKSKEELASKNNGADTRRIYLLQRRVDELTEENAQLRDELRNFAKAKKPKEQVLQLQRAVSNLERSVVMERNSHHELVEKLRRDKAQLTKQLEKIKCSEKSLKLKLDRALSQASRTGFENQCKTMAEPRLSNQSVKTMYRRTPSPFQKADGLSNYPKVKTMRSRTSSTSSTNRYLDPEAGSVNSSRRESPSLTPKRKSRNKSLLIKSRCSSENSSRASSRASSRTKKHLDYRKLEEKIEHLQRMLRSNLRTDN